MKRSMTKSSGRSNVFGFRNAPYSEFHMRVCARPRDRGTLGSPAHAALARRPHGARAPRTVERTPAGISQPLTLRALLQMRGATGTVGCRRNDSALAAGGRCRTQGAESSKVSAASAVPRGGGGAAAGERVGEGAHTLEKRQMLAQVVNFVRVKGGQRVELVNLVMQAFLI